MQDDNQRFQRAYLKATNCIAFVAFPLMLGMCALSDPFVLAVFGARWHPVALLLMILAPVGMVQAIGTTVGGIYQAKGRTDWMFRWGLASGLISVLAFIVGLRWGIVGVATAYAVVELLILYPSFAIPFRLISLRFNELLLPLSRPFVCSVIMLLFLLLLGPVARSNLSAHGVLLILVPLGSIVYLLMSLMINRQSVLQMVELGWAAQTRVVASSIASES
jgi:PST family polysaccharide transporter